MKARPDKIRLLQEQEFIGQHRGRPTRILLPVGAIGIWHSIGQCFTFPEHKHNGWNPYLWWDDLKDHSHTWESVIKKTVFFNWLRWQCLNKKWIWDEIPPESIIDQDQFTLEMLKILSRR